MIRLSPSVLAALCALNLALPFAQEAFAEEAAPPAVTQEQIAAWIKELGDEDFGKRDAAEKNLLKAGAPALDALREAAKSTDVETRTRAAALSQRIGWLRARPDAVYTELFPSNAIFAVHLNSLKDYGRKARTTALGKLVDGPDFKPLADLLLARLKSEMPAGTWDRIVNWTDKMGGQMAAAAWDVDIPEFKTARVAAVVQLPADDPAKAFEAFLGETGMAGKLQPKDLSGLTAFAGPRGDGVFALVGRHLVVANNEDAVLAIAQGLIEPQAENLAKTPDFKKIQGEGTPPDFVLLINIEQYLATLNGMMGMAPGGGAGFMDLMKKAGYGSITWFALTSAVKDDVFEERMVITSKTGAFEGFLAQMASQPQDAAAMRAVFEVVPPKVALAGNFPLDGAAMGDFGLEYAKMLMRWQAMQFGAPAPAEGAEDAEIKKLEDALGLKFKDLAASIKGPAVYWVDMPQALAAPDIGFALTCPDEAKAKELTANLAKLVNGLAKYKAEQDAQAAGGQAPADVPPIVKPVEEGGVTIYTEPEDSPYLKDIARQRMPYRLTLAAAGKRVIAGSGLEQIKARLAALAKQTPGFDPAKVLPAGDDASTVFYLNVPDLTDFGARLGLPILAMAKKNDKELTAECSKLIQKKDLFATVPPLTISTPPAKNGVLVSTIRSPLPALPTYFGVLGGVMVGFTRGAAVMAPMAVPPPPPPGGGGF